MSSSEWIGVKDKLPEVIGEEMLVVGSSGLGPEPYITLVEYLGNGHWGTTRDDVLNGFNPHRITYWMPLPMPPAEAHAHAARRWEEGQAIIREAERQAANTELRKHFVSSGKATGIDNEQIDHDLAREYDSTHDDEK